MSKEKTIGNISKSLRKAIGTGTQIVTEDSEKRIITKQEMESYYKKINGLKDHLPQVTYEIIKQFIIAEIRNKIIDKPISFHKENGIIVENLIKYFMNMEGVYDLRKGLYIFGEVGTGKSTIVQIIVDVLNKNRYNYSDGDGMSYFSYVDYLNVIDKIESTGNANYISTLYDRDVIYDDFVHAGRCLVKVGYNSINLAEKIIRNQYLRKANRLVYITNHRIRQLAKDDFLGTALAGRIQDSCTEIYWHGEENELRPGMQKPKISLSKKESEF